MVSFVWSRTTLSTTFVSHKRVQQLNTPHISTHLIPTHLFDASTQQRQPFLCVYIYTSFHSAIWDAICCLFDVFVQAKVCVRFVRVLTFIHENVCVWVCVLLYALTFIIINVKIPKAPPPSPNEYEQARLQRVEVGEWVFRFADIWLVSAWFDASFNNKVCVYVCVCCLFMLGGCYTESGLRLIWVRCIRCLWYWKGYVFARKNAYIHTRWFIKHNIGNIYTFWRGEIGGSIVFGWANKTQIYSNE